MYTTHPRPASFLTTLLILTAGCDFLGTDRPSEAQVIIDGDADATVNVITSQNFFMGFSDEMGTDVSFVEADTVVVNLPFDETYDLRPSAWFAVRLTAPEDQTPEVHMRVLLDGSERFNQSGVLEDQHMQYFVTHN